MQDIHRAPGLKTSVTLNEILTGVEIANGLPWADIQAAVKTSFRDPELDAVAVEDIAADLAQIPAIATIAVPVEDIAQLIILLCKLGVIKEATPPQDGPDGINPYSCAPLGT